MFANAQMEKREPSESAAPRAVIEAGEWCP